ncbi:MAG: hypothetical protein RR053_06670 [Evtepia sp.]
MKTKILSLLLIAVVISQLITLPVWGQLEPAQRDFIHLRNMGILPAELTSDVQWVTQGQLNNVASRLRASAVKGVNEETAVQPASAEQTAEVILDALGYRSVIEMGSYVAFAHKLGLLHGVDSSAGITPDQFAILCMDALKTKMASVEYKTDGTDLHQGGGKMLVETLGYSLYRGVVETVEDTNYTAQITIDSVELSSGREQVKAGDRISMQADGSLDINHFSHAPVEVWTGQDGKIVSILETKNTEIRYAYIYSVNGDAEEHQYQADYIKKIALFDDKRDYNLAQSAVIYYNGALVGDTAIGLTGQFVKLVLVQNKVTAIEGWELSRGGIIESVKSDGITYTKGDRKGLKFPAISDFTKVLVYIDKQSRDKSELKADSYFDYYKDEDNDVLVLVASERTMLETLHTVGTEELMVGDAIYAYRADNFYLSVDGETYKKSTEFSGLFNRDVKGYLDANGYITYLRCYTDDKMTSSEFIGIVAGAVKGGMFQQDQIRLVLVDNKIETKDFIIAKKVALEDGLSLEDVFKNARNYDGKGVYKFKTNALGEVKRIKKLKPLEGFGDAIASPTQFVNDSLAYMNVGGRTLYFDGAKMVGIYQRKGEFSVKEVRWNDLNNRSCSGTQLQFYAEEGSSDVSLVVLSKDLTGIYRAEETFGLVTGKVTAVDEDGDTICKLTVVSKNSEHEYAVTQEIAETVPNNSHIVFREGVLFDDQDIRVMGMPIDLTAPREAWTVSSMGTDGVKTGVVKKIDNRRIYFEDGEIYYMHPYDNEIFRVYEGAANRFALGSIGEIDIGKRITYILYYNEIRAVFYE